MPVEVLTVGQLSTNCYLFYEEIGKDCCVIDPGDDADYIINRIKDLELKPQLILATHAHFDHVLAVPELKLGFNIPFYLHQADLGILKRQTDTAQYFLGQQVDPPLMPDKYLKEGGVIGISRMGRISRKGGEGGLKVIETPGHTPGSCVFLTDDRPSKKHIIFAGDLLFSQGNCGRTDLAGGDFEFLQKSIKKVLSLDPETIIYPGHGEQTSVAQERKYWQHLLS